MRAIFIGNHCEKKLADMTLGAGPDLMQRVRNAFDLDLGEFFGQPRAFCRHIQPPFAAVFVAGALDDDRVADADILAGRAAGVATFDFGGIDASEGLEEFKRQWNPQRLEYAGEFTLRLRPLAGRLVEALVRVYKNR